MDQEHLVLLGRIDGKLNLIAENQTSQAIKLEEIDRRLRAVEVSAAKSGGISGAVVAGILTAGIEIAKRKLGL